MIHFGQPVYLWLLLLVPFLGMLIYLWVRWRQKAMDALAAPEVQSRLLPNTGGASLLRSGLFSLGGLTLLIISLAEPRIGGKPQKSVQQGLDMVIAIDVSRSMDAQDLRPSRLARARQLASRLAQGSAGDRIGLVVFAGHAYIQSPLTTDASALQMFLEDVNTAMVPTQGTDIGGAAEVAERLLYPQDTKELQIQTDAAKALVIISDGEDHESRANEAVKRIADRGTLVYTVGAGDPQGGRIPIKTDGQYVEYLRDANDEEVVSIPNESMLRELAHEGNGSYYRLTSSESALNGLQKDLHALERSEKETITYTGYTSLHPWFLGLGAGFILADYLLHGLGIGRSLKNRRRQEEEEVAIPGKVTKEKAGQLS